MRIESVRLVNYKRFTDLRIAQLPSSARLVVLTGPNGSGKSSLFDAFLLKSQSTLGNYGLDGDREGYYSKTIEGYRQPGSTHEISRGITIEFHSFAPSEEDWSGCFNVRSPYRNEADFRISSLQPTEPAKNRARFNRIIDVDRAVSDNYGRMAWKRMSDLDRDAPGATTFGQYRREYLSELQEAMVTLFSDPALRLQDFGGLRDSGVFRFAKGTASNFHYKNLSGGEKAAFDLLLDIFVKRYEYGDAIYCIDEPEAHAATALHGRLLDVMLKLLPNDAQLWIATHSIGFVRRAYQMMRHSEDVVFLDFSERDFDSEVVIVPQSPDRRLWRNTYKIALDDLADLVAPDNIVICEGSRSAADHGFDAKCYNRIFSDAHPETLFISRGGSTQVEDSEDLMTVLKAITRGIRVWRLIDRDDMTDAARRERIQQGIRVLDRREIENYLYDPRVLRSLYRKHGIDDLADDIVAIRQRLLDESPEAPDDVKAITQDLFQAIRGHFSQISPSVRLGNSRAEFAVEHLASAVRDSDEVYEELRRVVFPG